MWKSSNLTVSESSCTDLVVYGSSCTDLVVYGVIESDATESALTEDDNESQYAFQVAATYVAIEPKVFLPLTFHRLCGFSCVAVYFTYSVATNSTVHVCQYILIPLQAPPQWRKLEVVELKFEEAEIPPKFLEHSSETEVVTPETSIETSIETSTETAEATSKSTLEVTTVTTTVTTTEAVTRTTTDITTGTTTEITTVYTTEVTTVTSNDANTEASNAVTGTGTTFSEATSSVTNSAEISVAKPVSTEVTPIGARPSEITLVENTTSEIVVFGKAASEINVNEANLSEIAVVGCPSEVTVLEIPSGFTTVEIPTEFTFDLILKIALAGIPFENLVTQTTSTGLTVAKTVSIETEVTESTETNATEIWRPEIMETVITGLTETTTTEAPIIETCPIENLLADALLNWDEESMEYFVNYCASALLAASPELKFEQGTTNAKVTHPLAICANVAEESVEIKKKSKTLEKAENLSVIIVEGDAAIERDTVHDVGIKQCECFSHLKATLNQYDFVNLEDPEAALDSPASDLKYSDFEDSDLKKFKPKDSKLNKFNLKDSRLDCGPVTNAVDELMKKLRAGEYPPPQRRQKWKPEWVHDKPMPRPLGRRVLG